MPRSKRRTREQNASSLPSELWSAVARSLAERDKSRTVLHAVADLCALQSVCRVTRNCAASAFDKLTPWCDGLAPISLLSGMAVQAQYVPLMNCPAKVPTVVYIRVLQERQKIRRQENLKSHLAQHGLELRADSHLCSSYIASGLGDPAHIATVMSEMAWLFKNTKYGEVLQKVCKPM